MVYCGKPSRGCQNCKTRRIKCDEVRPACTQCRRSGRTCPGYPDEFDLIFRNENVAVARRAARAAGPRSSPQASGSYSNKTSPRSESSSPSVSPSNSLVLSSSPQSQPDVWDLALFRSNSNESEFAQPSEMSLTQAYLWWLSTVPSVPVSLPPSVEAQATAFFFKNFIELPQEPESMRGFLELLTPLYNSTSSSSTLHRATSAVALSFIGRYPGREEFMRQARMAYGQALQHIGAAITDPVESKSDETLLAIMLFTIYEAITGTMESGDAWSKHVDGAVALVRLRGKEQFNNPQSLAVFRAVRTLMLTNCIQNTTPVPDFPGPRGWVEDEDMPGNAANRLTVLCIDLPTIRERARAVCERDLNPESEAEALSLIETARRVDTDLENWYLNLPEKWAHRTISVLNEMPADILTSEQWIGPVHVYDDMNIANIINDYRLSRIFCHTVVLNCADFLDGAPQDSPIETYRQIARFIIQQMVDDICASVPFHIQYSLQPEAQQINQDYEAANTRGGYFLVRPLFVAMHAEGIPPEQKLWLRGCMERIGAAFGLTGAQVMILARKHVLTSSPSWS